MEMPTNVKVPPKVTHEYKHEIPIPELKKILEAAGYNIPSDATLVQIGYGDDAKLVVSWSRNARS